MTMIKIAVVGYGNIGKAVIEAVNNAADMELVGVVRRNSSLDSACKELDGIKVVSEVEQLGKVDVAVLCTPSRLVPHYAAEYAKKGICTVDSFDIHTQVPTYRKEQNTFCIENNTVSILSAGWDPGSDSVVRALYEAMAPKGLTYTNFGPGRSMGHSVAVKAIEGVEDALSMTIPLGTGIHRRMVYAKIKEGYSFAEIEKKIKQDDYFVHDETHVVQVDDVNQLNDVGHGVNLVRKGVSGATHNQLFEFNMRINNPALTGQILVSCARAAMKMKHGAYTMIEIPPVYYLEGEVNDLVKRLV